MKDKQLISHDLSPSPKIANAQTRALEDVWLPCGGGARVRIRTLIYDKGDRGREAWLAEELPPALGPEGQGAAIFLGRQCHGTLIADADQDEAIPAGQRHEFDRCDGLVTRRAAVALAVRTADCVPIVASDAARPWLGAVHAGWRGTLDGILALLLEGAKRDGSRPGDLHLWIGPHIHACHYEISEQLSHRFQDAFPERPVMRNERHLSLREANMAQAARAGIDPANILSSPLCTFEECNNLPSYRRDGQCRGEIVTTAMIVRGV